MRKLLLPVLAVLLMGGCSKLVVGELYDYDLYDLYDDYPYGDGSTVGRPRHRDGREGVYSICGYSRGGMHQPQGTTDVKIQGNLATITPYDYERYGHFRHCQLQPGTIHHFSRSDPSFPGTWRGESDPSWSLQR